MLEKYHRPVVCTEYILHSTAVLEASGFQVAITDDANVLELVARLVNEGHESGVAWDDLTARARKRLGYWAKKWLNTRAVEQMTAARLAERDGGEVWEWLETIRGLGR